MVTKKKESRIIDFRSDTVTRPSQEMRQAMAEAEVGDDGYEDDPTVKKLEQKTAKIFGKEAALFFPSGTMANQTAILTHTLPGQEIILGSKSHIFNYEAGAPARLSGVQTKILPENSGCLEPEDISAAIRAENIHFPQTGLVCLENTHNREGGRVISKERLDLSVNAAKEKGIPVHLDGARIFNAIADLSIKPASLVENFDSVMCCLSKGLGAPVGSMLAGSERFILKARKNRQLLGGGMRQVGILAAAGLVALKNRSRLINDHELARYLAETLRKCNSEYINVMKQETNFVILEYNGPEGALWLKEQLAEEGVLANNLDDYRLRLVTHCDLNSDDVDEFGKILNNIL